MTLKPHGVSFTGEMMRGLLNVKPGSWPAEPIDASKPFKFQTRRLVNLTDNGSFPWAVTHLDNNGVQFDGPRVSEYRKFPHVVGQPIWAREAFTKYRARTADEEEKVSAIIRRFEAGKVKDIVGEALSIPHSTGDYKFLYAADFGEWAYNVDSDLGPWKPSIHMPFVASRYHGEVMRVRVERLCDITEEDAIAEGIEEMQDDHEIYWRHYGVTDKTMGFLSPVDSYKSLIESIHGKDVWESWVWVYDIKRTK